MSNYPEHVTGSEPEIVGRWDDTPMYVVVNYLTGYSDEDMRFADETLASEWIEGQDTPEEFIIREDS